jgi:hypothetical protein
MPAYDEIPVQAIKIREGDAPLLMARLLNSSGAYVTQAMLAGATITANVYDFRSTTPRVAIFTAPLTISQVIFDTPQLPVVPVGNDPIWKQDETGYTFIWQLPSAQTQLAIPGNGHRRVEVICAPASGQPFCICAYDVTIAELLSYG